MMKKRSRKRFAAISLACIILLIGCACCFFGQNSPHPDLLPEGSEGETLLFNISYGENFVFPEEQSMQIYKNRIDRKDSLRRVALFLNLDVSNFIFREESAVTMFDSYKVPGGICEIEKSTGYWRYVSDEADEIQAKKESEFISDEEIIHNVKFFLSERGIFEKDEYTVDIVETMQGNGDAGVLVLEKNAYIYPLIDCREVLGVYRLILSFDSKGEIIGISSYYNPAEEYKSVELKSEQDAKNSLKEGNFSSSATEPLFDVKLEEVLLAYYSDAEPNREGFFLFPVYVFHGTGRPAGGGERINFNVIVDGVKN